MISLDRVVMSNRNLGVGEGRQPWALGMQQVQQSRDSLAVVCVDLGDTTTSQL